jgi:hypothetical protein
MLKNIFAGDNIKIYGENKHIAYLKKRALISAVSVKLPHGRFLSVKMVLFEFIVLLRIWKERPNLLFLLSVTPFTIIISNILFRNIGIFFFFHGILETLYTKYHFYNYHYWLRPAFGIQRKNNINIVLGKNIGQELKKIVPNVIHVFTLDLPYPRYDKSGLSFSPKTIIKIGTIGFGAIKKGSHLIFDLEKKMQSNNINNIELHYIGQILDPGIKIPGDTSVKFHGEKNPLEEEDFNNLIDAMRYCIFFYPMDSYKLTASGAVFDALTHLKPIIVIRNAYFEYLFQKMGNIGYLCDSLEEILNCIKNIVNSEGINETYNEQQRNIDNGLKYFSIEYLEKELKNIIGSLLYV